ncbi:MAG: glucose-1-phosphate adenylyltransferase [Planctomycetes bacterium]|nr:glucose-1-phosphate adenylyltransferase [Planctomycetota bacterium]
MQAVLALILGGGRGKALYPLTRHRSKAAVPIAGKYRLIDIPLSNCLNSGINRIYVLTQYLSVSLHNHLTNTYKFDPFSQGFVEALAAQVTNEAADWYRGTADALRQNIPYLFEDPARDFLILSDDQLYRFDFRRLVQAHRDSRADATIAVVPVPRSQATSLGVVGVDETGRITAFVEKPQTSAQLDQLRIPIQWRARWGISGDQEYLANMGTYLFRRESLLELLNGPTQADDLVLDIFPRAIETHHFQSYLFTQYWGHMDTIPAYHEANLALTGDQPAFDFFTPDEVIFTRMRNLPAARISGARLNRALISDGCWIAPGTQVERSVIGVRSLIGRNVILREAIVLGANFYETDAERQANREQGQPDVGVGEGSVLERVILDKNCRIGRGVQIVNHRRLQEAEGNNYVIRDGIVVLAEGTVVPDGMVI